MAGIRDSKIVDGVTYNYLTLDGKVVRQTWGNNTFDVIYDPNGQPFACRYNDVYYVYVLNQQGDVIRIINGENGATVAEYQYDAWGNVLEASGALAEVNPLRYRGYYYDTETGFYYLQSRYYDPGTGRFINADSFASTGQDFLGYNMFAYCGNNPVNCADPTGHFWGVAFVVAICAVVLAGCSSNEVGVAPEYKQISESNSDRSKNPNCYSYAIGYYDQSYNPGDFSKPFTDFTVDAVAEAVKSDLEALGRNCRPINSYNSPIADNEYRIALRVSEPKFIMTPKGLQFDWDYHFMVQTSTGNWAEKHGPGGATVFHESGNPSTISWDCGSTKGYYTSEIQYFAITK